MNKIDYENMNITTNGNNWTEWIYTKEQSCDEY